MKKLLFILIIISSFSTINAQNDVLIGLDASWKYMSRQETLNKDSYQGTWSYDVGFSIMKRIRWTGLFWQTGLNFNQFNESLEEFGSSHPDTPDPEIIVQRTSFKRYAVSLPLGLKIFFSDRKCIMFAQPGVSFDYYFRDKKTIEQYTSYASPKKVITTKNWINDQNVFVATARLAIGGHQKISEYMEVSIQLEGTYGLFGTGTFQDNQPWSVGIRSGVLYRL